MMIGSSEDESNDGKLVVEKSEKLGFFVQNQEFLDSLGGNPNTLSDDEFEAVFG